MIHTSGEVVVCARNFEAPYLIAFIYRVFSMVIAARASGDGCKRDDRMCPATAATFQFVEHDAIIYMNCLRSVTVSILDVDAPRMRWRSMRGNVSLAND